MAGSIIAIDGKTLRHSFGHGDPENSIHLISVWADGCGPSLGQLLVDVKGAAVSLDAMGCQKEIAQEIHFAKGDYLLALKANHGTLPGEVAALIADVEAMEYGREKGHGRIEHRVVKVTDYLDWFEPSERKHWLGLRSLVQITSTPSLKGETSTKKRYYLSSHAPDAEKLGGLVRRQRGIENRCHWVLDMTLDEDSCRARNGHAPENLALLRKPTINLLRHDQTIRDTMRGKRIRVALFKEALQTVMKLDSPE